MIAKIESYKEYCKKFIPEQYKSSQKLLEVIWLFQSQCDDLEDAFFEIFNSINLNEAVGIALDFIGALLGVYRIQGETDSDYRYRIRYGETASTLPSFEGVRHFLLENSTCSAVGLYPVYPAGLYAVFTGTPVENFDLNEKEIAANGVDLGLGTFMMWEEGENYGYITIDDNNQPFVCDAL